MGDGIMTNPNNNKNFNDEALKINRKLKKELDEIYETVFGLLDNGEASHDELIVVLKGLYDDSQTLEASRQDDYWSKQKAVKILHKKAMEVEE